MVDLLEYAMKSQYKAVTGDITAKSKYPMVPNALPNGLVRMSNWVNIRMQLLL